MHCVSVFGPRGEKLRSFGRFGFCEGQLDDPCGVTLDGVGSILVADCGNHRIQKFTNEGQFITAVGIKGSEPLHFSYPTDIALNTFNDKFYVVENGNHRVQILNSDFTFGKEGSGKGHFKCPSLVACDSTGKVYVADVCNHRIQVFTAEGKFLWMFGRRGRGRGELDMPIGIAIDTSDQMVYVSELGNHRISAFTSDGQFVSSFGSHGKKPGEFKRPRGLAVDDDGVVFVCDGGNKRVQLF